MVVGLEHVSSVAKLTEKDSMLYQLDTDIGTMLIPVSILSTPNGRGPGKRPLEQEPEVSTPPCRRPRLSEPEVSTNPLSRPQEGGLREEDEHQRLQHIDEGDDRSPHHPRLPEPEISTLPLGRPQEENEQREGEDDDEYSDDDDYDAIFRQMAEGLI
jgi:hypothetical protein